MQRAGFGSEGSGGDSDGGGTGNGVPGPPKGNSQMGHGLLLLWTSPCDLRGIRRSRNKEEEGGEKKRTRRRNG